MARETVHLFSDTRNAVGRTAAVLRGGGVAVFPTETVYGIGVISGDADALARLRRLKGRDGTKPFQFLAADREMAELRLGAVFSARAKNVATAFWPGPLTIVVPDGSGDGDIGVRVPDSPLVLELCRLLERPIIASSANPAGLPPPADAEAADAFGDEVDILVDGGAIAGGLPSTVMRVRGDGFELLRGGSVHAKDIASAWNA